MPVLPCVLAGLTYFALAWVAHRKGAPLTSRTLFFFGCVSLLAATPAGEFFRDPFNLMFGV